MIDPFDMKESKPIVSLDLWYVSYSESVDAFTAPELYAQVLVGKVYGHPHPDHYDGKDVRTSEIISQGRLNEFSTVETKNTIYLLGTMEPGYKEWCDKNNHI